MRSPMLGLALVATALTALSGCAAATSGTTTTAASGAPDASAGATGGLGDAAPSKPVTPADPVTSTKPATSAHSSPPVMKTSTAAGPQIVYFKVAQKPKCAEGTAVFRAAAVPLIIEWKISHATSGALSVDDTTHTAGTYGPVELSGSQEFPFSCRGPVGSSETHTYAIYTVGGGAQRSKALTVSAKVLDQGKPVS